MLTLDQTLEALALALPRIGGDHCPYTLPLVVTFEREIYPYLVGAVGVGCGGTKAAEQLKTFAESLTRSDRRELLVRALDAIVIDAYDTLAASGHAVPDMTEAMKAPERAYVARIWSERAQSPSWRALLDSLILMHERRTAPGTLRAAAHARYVGECVELTVHCDLGNAGERAIVSEKNGDAMILWFRDHDGRKVATGTDYAYLRRVCGCDLKATDGNHSARCPERTRSV